MNNNCLLDSCHEWVVVPVASCYGAWGDVLVGNCPGALVKVGVDLVASSLCGVNHPSCESSCRRGIIDWVGVIGRDLSGGGGGGGVSEDFFFF